MTDPIGPRVETREEVGDRVLAAAEFIPRDQLGTTDDCGFSPFGDDTSTSREIAFAKIRARLEPSLPPTRSVSSRDPLAGRPGGVVGRPPGPAPAGRGQCRRRARSVG